MLVFHRDRRAAGGWLAGGNDRPRWLNFIVCGGCGVLDQAITTGHPVILTAAVRMKAPRTITCPPAGWPRPGRTPPLPCSGCSSAQRVGVPHQHQLDNRRYLPRDNRPACLAPGGGLFGGRDGSRFILCGGLEFRGVDFGRLPGGDLVVPKVGIVAPGTTCPMTAA